MLRVNSASRSRIIGCDAALLRRPMRRSSDNSGGHGSRQPSPARRAGPNFLDPLPLMNR